MKEEIKQLRVKIDGLARLAKELNNSKQIEKSVDSLFLAKAWLGKALGSIGEENPYKSGYKTKEDIEPTADVNYAKEMLVDVPYISGTYIEKVDWLRTEIQNLSTPLVKEDNPILKNLFTECQFHLIEARFWLGFELERIREEK